jgi:RHS repeat-associated protein
LVWPWQIDGAFNNTLTPDTKYRYNGKELNEDLGLNMYDYGARFYDPSVGRFTTVDPAAHEYANVSPYTYVLNNPINAKDPDGRRVFFVGGAGNDQIGWNYTSRWERAFTNSGINGFVRLNVSHDNASEMRNGGMPLGDMNFTSSFRSSRNSQYLSSTSNMVETYRKNDKMVNKAISDISSNISANPLGKDEQLNLAGYSYGSVVQAHAALGLADKGQKINNLILIGSPISSDSDLFKEISNHSNIGNVIRVDIQGDFLSDPKGLDFLKGVFQNLGIEGAHFDLARPGAKADKKIQETTDDLKKKGVN